MADRDAALQALLDKQEITELLTRYLRSVDRGDVATLRSCYTAANPSTSPLTPGRRALTT